MAKRKRFLPPALPSTIEPHPPTTLKSGIFFILLCGTFCGILTSAFIKKLQPLIAIICIGMSIWLGIGVLVYLKASATYTSQRAQTGKLIEQLHQEQQRVEVLLTQYPTARVLLLKDFSLSYQLGETQRQEELKKKLLQIDPNDLEVQEVLNKVSRL